MHLQTRNTKRRLQSLAEPILTRANLRELSKAEDEVKPTQGGRKGRDKHADVKAKVDTGRQVRKKSQAP